MNLGVDMGERFDTDQPPTAARPGRGRRRLGLVAAALALVLLAVACEAVPGDFTGDRKADFVSWDQNGNWYQAGQTTPMWTGPSFNGPEAAMAVAGDYNGDGKWEPAELVGTTWTSSALSAPIDYIPPGLPAGPAATLAPIAPYGSPFTPPTLLPVQGDYDGTGKTVPAYYDQVDGSWWIMGHPDPVRFGTPPSPGGNYGYSVPVPADYDGDGKTDIAIFDPTTSTFHYLSSKTGQEVVIQEGHPGDMPVPADYDKVGHAEAAVTDLSGGIWCVVGHTGAFATFAHSPDEAVPVPADYNGDGTADPAVFDIHLGRWTVRGQPSVTGPIANPAFPAGIPASVVVNVVRLTLFFEQLVDIGPPTLCDGS